MAGSTISIPITCFVLCVKNSEIVPVLQYASITVSSPFKSA